jgi:lysozyme family protein
MRTNFEKCYTIVRVYEGGNVNNKKDPGGRTSRGVTQATYNAYRRHKGQPTKDVYAATDVEVKDIYKTQYWLTSGADSAPVGVDLVLFDAAINSGSNRAIRLLQASLNAVDKIQPPLAVDGNMGAHTLDAMTVNKDNDKLIGEYGKRRQGFYQGLSTWSTFGKGWTERNKNCVKIAQAWAAGSIGPKPKTAFTLQAAPTLLLMGNAKADDADIPTAETVLAPSSGLGVTTTGGIGVAGSDALNTVAEKAHGGASMLEPILQYSSYITFAFVILTLLGVGITGFGVYREWRGRKLRTAQVSAPLEEPNVSN